MATVEVEQTTRTFAALWDQLGNVPLERIHIWPRFGDATEEDVITIRQTLERRLCELIDGVLVEKTAGLKESYLAVVLGSSLWNYLDTNDLGFALGAGGMMQMAPGMVRIPDVSFVFWDRLPDRKLSDKPIADLVPDLAVEVLSPSNTPKEMQRKLADYFQAGVQVVWYIQPKTKTAEIFTSPTDKTDIAADGVLQAESILPGFKVSLADLFAKVP